MSVKRNAMLLKAIVATSPVSLFLLQPNIARATATWTGAVSNSWGDAANWAGTAPIPPGVALATNGAAQGDAWIGNNSTVFYNNYLAGSGTIVIGRLHLGYSGIGAALPGDGTLVMNAGSLSTQQFNTIGAGAVGTLIVSGGMIDFH